MTSMLQKSEMPPAAMALINAWAHDQAVRYCIAKEDLIREVTHCPAWLNGRGSRLRRWLCRVYLSRWTLVEEQRGSGEWRAWVSRRGDERTPVGRVLTFRPEFRIDASVPPPLFGVQQIGVA